MSVADLTAKDFEGLEGKDAVFVVEAFGGELEDGTTVAPIKVELTLVKVEPGPKAPAELPAPEGYDGPPLKPRDGFTLLLEGHPVTDPKKPHEACPTLPCDTYRVTNAKLGDLGDLLINQDAHFIEGKDGLKSLCLWSRKFTISFN